jgi:hypothetical protein
MEALVDQRMKEMEASWKTQRTDVASVVSVQLMTIFFEKTYGDLWRRGYFQNSNSFSKKQPWDRWWRWLTNGFITKPAESTVNEMKSIIARR